MELFSGERFIFDDNNFLKVISGKIEVYFVSKDAENFRQMFVMHRQAGEFIFPAADDFHTVETLIYAAEDSVIEKISPAQISTAEMRLAMENWFSNLISLQWLRMLADKGDDTLKHWIDKSIFAECGDDKEKILDAFVHNEQIFSMLVGVRFQSEEKQLGDRIDIRKRQKHRLVEDSISTLLGEDKIFYEEDEKNSRSQKSDEAVFIVKCVAAAMKMPPADLTVNPDILKKLDAVGVIRRLIQKQNM